MTLDDLFQPLAFTRGPAMKNRFMLAPLTNLQSHPDGTLSDDELRWLTYRAKGGFGATMTCAAHVQAQGQGFPGQLGIWKDAHVERLTLLASAIKAEDSVALVQLHHAGIRSPKELIGTQPVGPSDDEQTGSRALSTAEVEQLVEDFVLGAKRAEAAGFDGVEIHGAHSYILCAFLSPGLNRREDHYGGNAENRARVVREIISGIRARCRPDFIVGLRLSPERFDLVLTEIRDLAQNVMTEGAIDFLDMSLWDIFKEPADEAYQGRSLMSYFTELERGKVKLGVAGKIMSPAHALFALEQGADFPLLGRAAILHHDYPKLLAANRNFEPIKTPVTAQHLRNEGLGEAFIGYMKGWAGFVAEEVKEDA